MTNGLKIGKILIMRTFYIYLIILISSIIAGCAQIEEKDIYVASESLVTKSYGDKYPFISVYIETNDVNPLNAGDYMLDDGTSFFDIVELFASNIHKDPYGNPTLFLNDKLANILEKAGLTPFIVISGTESTAFLHVISGTETTAFLHVISNGVRST